MTPETLLDLLGSDEIEERARGLTWAHDRGEKLSDPSPTVRRASIRTLMALDDVASREAIARLLTDDTLDPNAWFDDDATVAQLASALAALDRPR